MISLSANLTLELVVFLHIVKSENDAENREMLGKGFILLGMIALFFLAVFFAAWLVHG
jgi:hypothetical protein